MLNNQDDVQRDIHLDLAFITKFGLKLSEGVVLGHLYPRLKRFREPVPYTNKRLCTELPCVTGKRDTMFRHVTVLVERGLLIKEIIRGVQYLGLRGDCGWAAYDSNDELTRANPDHVSIDDEQDAPDVNQASNPWSDLEVTVNIQLANLARPSNEH